MMNFCDPDAGLIMKDFPSTLALKDRELREDKSTFTTKDSDYLCTDVTTARKVLRDESSGARHDHEILRFCVFRIRSVKLNPG